MKKLFSLCLLVNCALAVTAQQPLKGRITDKHTNEPLAGANIAIRKSNIIVSSDNAGYFIIANPPETPFILIISYTGYEMIEIRVSTQQVPTTSMNVELQSLYKSTDSIVVSASRRPEKITDAPASIQVIGQRELNQFSGSNVGELAAYVQGVEFVRMGVDNVSFNARGLNNAFNNKVYQLVDGRNSMNPLSGSLMMGNNFSVVKEDIEKIEILLGPQTALYGPNVHNALFNYITKDPRKYQGTTLAFSAGNQNQFSGRLRQAEKINSKWAYKITAEYASGKDFEFYDSVYAGGGQAGVFGPAIAIPERINFDFRRIRGEGHLYYSIKPAIDFILSAGGSNNNTINTHTAGRNQFVNVTNSFLQARFTSPRLLATVYNAWADFGESYNVVGYTRDFWNRTHSTATSGPNARLFPEEAEKFAKRPGNSFKESPQRFNAEAQYNYIFSRQKLFLVVGLSYQKDKPRGFGINLVDSFERIYIRQYGAVLQIEKTLPWRLKFIGAARVDNHSNFGNFFSPKLGLVKGIASGNFRVTWGRAYSMPSVLYQYARTAGLFFGNGEGIRYVPVGAKFSDPASVRTTQPLVPEEVNTWDIGYKGSFFKKLSVDVSYYNGLSKNFFTPSIGVLGRAISVGGKPVTHNPAFAGVVVNDTLWNANFSTIFNFGAVKVYGFDIGTSYDFDKVVNLTVRYSWIGSDLQKGNRANDANKDGVVLADEKSLNSPRNRFVSILTFQNFLKQKAFASIAARYVEQFDFYSGNQISTQAGRGKRGVVEGPNGLRYIKNFDQGPLGGFTTFDLRAGYKFKPMVSMSMGITNMFNTEQREFAGSPSIGRLITVEVKVDVH